MHLGASYYVWEQALPQHVCEAIIEEWDPAHVHAGTVEARDGSFDRQDEVRRADTMPFGPTHWVRALPLHYAALANARTWNFDISSVDATLLTRYEPGGHYGWHHDITGVQVGEGQPEQHRKLSIVAALSDPSDYEGGRLRFKHDGREIDDQRVQQQGSITVFPSYVFHMVEPLSSGIRFTLVSWLVGRPFR